MKLPPPNNNLRRFVNMPFRIWDAICLKLRLWLLRLRYPSIEIGPGVVIDPNVFIRTMDGGSIRIGANTHIWRGSIIEARGGALSIGENGLINAGCYILACGRIDIGANALIAEYVTIRDQDHAHEDNGIPYAEQGRVVGDITIGENVWIGAKSTITRNVTIAAGTIVGANSVVTKSLSGARIFAGAPARPLVKEPQ